MTTLSAAGWRVSDRYAHDGRMSGERANMTPSLARVRPVRVLLRALVAVALAATGLVAALAGPARADYTSSNLPNWAIGPFTRSPANPILTAPGTGWDAADVYNPGVVVNNGKFQMLFRGQNNNDSDHISQVGYATSTNGTSFTPYSGNPVITNSLPSESHDIEDPRLYYLNGTYYSFFTGNSGGIDVNEATSTDMVHWTQVGPVETNNKDAAVVTNGSDVPVMIDGKYVMYYGQNGNGTYIAYSTDMVHWTTGPPVSLGFPPDYTPWELCVAVTDYPTVAGQPDNTSIVLFDAGTLMAHGRWYYAISEVEFSGTHLTQELGQLTDAVLSPSAPYEISGQTPRRSLPRAWRPGSDCRTGPTPWTPAGDPAAASATSAASPATG